jgi:hypothetical protein
LSWGVHLPECGEVAVRPALVVQLPHGRLVLSAGEGSGPRWRSGPCCVASMVGAMRTPSMDVILAIASAGGATVSSWSIRPPQGRHPTGCRVNTPTVG